MLNAWTETWLSGEFADWTIERAAPSVKCPLLVIHGEEDEYGSLCHPPRFAQLTSASSESLILSGCHHVPHREMPEQVLGAVMRLIREAHC
ncbi:Alpha/beta hydrolase family protein [compost metagenome]